MKVTTELRASLEPTLNAALMWAGYVDAMLSAAQGLLDGGEAPERVIDAIRQAKSAGGHVVARLTELESLWPEEDTAQEQS